MNRSIPAPEFDDQVDQIERYFETKITPQQADELSAALVADAALAREFVRAARHEAHLEKAFGAHAKPVRRSHPWRWVSAAAGLVAAVLVGWKFWPGKVNDSQTRITIQDVKTIPEAKDPATTSVVRRVLPNAQAAEPDLRDLITYLRRYMVEINLEGLTVPQALRQLHAAMKQVNFLKRPWVEQMRLNSSPPADGTERLLPGFLPHNTSAWSVLKTCALLQTVEIDVSPGVRYVLSAPRSGTFNGPQQKNFPRCNALFPELANSNDPSAEVKNSLSNKFGLVLDTDEEVVWLPESGTVVLTASQRKLAYFERVCELMMADSNQIRLDHVLVQCPSEALPAGFDANTGLIMSSEVFAKFTQSLSAFGPGEKMNILPSIVTQVHRVCSLEQFQNARTSGADSWVGFRLSTSPKLLGETVSCVGRSDFHLIGSDAVELPWEKVLSDAQSERLAQGEKITECPTEFDTYIPEGATAVFALDVPTTGGVLLHCLTAYSIDAAENRIDNGVNRVDLVKTQRAAIVRAKLVIDSQRMNVSNDGASANFSGDVRLRYADFGIDGDELTVFFQDDEDEASKKNLKVAKIEARTATFKINAFNQTGTAEQIEYDGITGIFTLSGWPKVENGAGTKIEGTTRETVFKLDGKGKVSTEGPAKTVTPNVRK